MLPFETASVRVANDLKNAERLTNEAMLAYAKLQQSVMVTRIETDVSPFQFQPSVMRLQQAQKSLIEAMSHLARVHSGMRADYLEVTGGPDEGGLCPTPTRIPGELSEVVKAA